jgi:hypothetical protein
MGVFETLEGVSSNVSFVPEARTAWLPQGLSADISRFSLIRSSRSSSETIPRAESHHSPKGFTDVPD